MKIKNILLMGLVLTAFSCEDFLGGDFNQDPNKPGTVPISALLPQIQISLADTYGGSFSRWNSMFTQQVEGVARQWSAFNQYAIQPVRFDDAMNDYYENVLVELLPVKAEAEELGYNHYLAVANMLEAFMIMTSVDVWGDIPYTEAGLGSENFSPAYDDDEAVYTAGFNLINEAISLFGQSPGAVAPGSEDLYYGGDVDQWLKAANALLARYYLHLGDYSNALSSAQASFEDRGDNMSYQYGTAPDGAQWHRFNDGRTGDIEFHDDSMGALMTSLNDDDRLEVLDVTFTPTGHPYLIDAFRQDLISYREIQFIIAESAFRLGQAATAHTAYLEAISASFEELGFEGDGAEYTAYVGQAAIDPGSGSLTLNHIMTQKYIGLFVQPEVFNDWRRTGIPSLTPVSGTAIPRRWNYGFNEYLFNANAPDENSVTLFAPQVFWDPN